MKKTLTVCSVLLTSVSSALLWGNQTVQTPSNKHAPSTKRSGPEDSPEPASPQTSGTVNILQMTDKIIFFNLWSFKQGWPSTGKMSIFLRPIWSQWFPERISSTMRDISQGSIIKYCLTWFNNKFLQESIIWVRVVQLKFCILVTPPLLLDFVYPPEEKTTQ